VFGAIGGFSALQRAENSSIQPRNRLDIAAHCVSVLFSEPKIPQLIRQRRARALQQSFQCSSASRKFLNLTALSACSRVARVSVLFSEPKIPQWYGRSCFIGAWDKFQCSSASRKFLNPAADAAYPIILSYVSVLFSEPKIPQSRTCMSSIATKPVSVLFSEPKIPQFYTRVRS